MAFIKNDKYFEIKIKNTEKAIKGTEKDMALLSSPSKIRAHQEQIDSYVKSLKQTISEYEKWKRQNS